MTAEGGAGGTSPSADLHTGFVALVGRPNAGKSTLLNRLVGSKVSIVSDKPQTTRRPIRGLVRLPGAEIAFLDTPGIHRPLHRMNQRMMQSVRETLSGADVIACVVDATEEFGRGDRYLLDLIAEHDLPRFLVLNKVDQIRPKSNLFPIIERWTAAVAFAEVHPISALTGDGVEALVADAARCLPVGPALFGDDPAPSDLSERFLAAEVVREKVLAETHAELPFSTTVLVEEYMDPGVGLVRIEASVVVERQSQKGILVGRNGASIQRIGTAARLDLEARLGRKVFLGLTVKVREHWREDDRLLDRLGVPG